MALSKLCLEATAPFQGLSHGEMMEQDKADQHGCE
jgi:hypothetical protein